MVSIANSGTKMARHLGITRPTGHYEITETAMAHFYQFEYDGPQSGTKKVKSPFILNGGYFDHITSTRGFSPIDQTLYIHMGGHVYHKQFSPANDPNSEWTNYTYRCPIIITGGEYGELYLSGVLESKENDCSYKAIFYASGGRIGTYASGGHEKINADVEIKANHIIADNFYAGGISPKAIYSITGNITTTLDYSIVHNVFCGANKYGNMASEKNVTTNATGTTFNIIYGAGYGGNATVKASILNKETTGNNMNSELNSQYNKGVYYSTVKNSNNKTINVDGINTDYVMELFPWSNSNQHCKRIFNCYSSLSLASVNDVTTNLNNCTILGNYYGGGNLGKVNGTATSILTSCTVYGDVFAGGNAATAPPAVVYDNPPTDKYPQFVGGVYINLDKNKYAPSANYIWTNTRPTGVSNTTYIWTDDNTGLHYIYADPVTADLSTIGTCTKTDLTIDGNTVVYGSVYGGGNEAETGNPGINLMSDDDAKREKKVHYTKVLVKDNAHITKDVVGAGKEGFLTGSTSVTIGDPNEPTHALNKIPWVEGDVYGGAYSADVDGYSNVTIYDGVLGPVYGGGYTGSVYKESDVKVLGGYIGYSKDIEQGTINPIVIPVGEPYGYFGVFGAGFGFGTSVGKDAHVQIGSSSAPDNTENEPVQHTHIYINGSVFGGGEAGQVGTGFEILHGKTVKATDWDEYEDKNGNTIHRDWDNWLVDGDAGTYRRISEVYPNAETVTNDPPNDHSFFAQFYKPSFETTTVSIQAPDKANGSLTTNIAGAVFGGGRGYYLTDDENNPGNYYSTLNTFKLAIAGAVYGSTQVTIGTEGHESGINIGSVNYYTDQTTATKYGLIDLSTQKSRAVFYDKGIYVYDLDSLKYFMVGNSSDHSYHRVLTNNGNSDGKQIGLWLHQHDPDVMYFINSGRASVVGGGEMGPVFGDKIFTTDGNDHQLSSTGFNVGSLRYRTTEGGNTSVTIYSGTIGDVRGGEVNGCVYGGGLNADVDGTSTVTIDGTSAIVRGDVYAGGCMGKVYAYNRQSADNTTTATAQYLQRGWVRNAHGGSNIAELGKGCNSKLVIGIEDEQGEPQSDDEVLVQSDDEVLVSESAYAASGFAPSLGEATLIMHHGRIGFVRPGFAINYEWDEDDPEHPGQTIHHTDAMSGDGIVQNFQGNLAYEGNLYGGGFGPMANVTKTSVTVNGGIIRNGVYGGGELAAVTELAQEGETRATATYHYDSVDNANNHVTQDVSYVVNADLQPLTSVTVYGGEMAMVFGGGRGYTNFMNTFSYTPGLVTGNTSVTINGGTVRSKTGTGNNAVTYYDANLGGGNVYGGGLEGEVTGNTSVTISGNTTTISGNTTTIEGRAFAGGRGYRGAMFGENADPEDAKIEFRATTNAGNVHGNTEITVSGGTIGNGVYGGGEGFNYTMGGNIVSVATVLGNAKVTLSGGTIGGGHGNVGENTTDNGSYAGGRIAPVLGTADIFVNGSADVAAVYGGNDISGKVYGTTRTGSEDDAYNSLNNLTETYVNVSGAAVKVGRVFGGGNGAYPGYYGTSTQYTYLHCTSPVQEKTYVDLNLTGAGTTTEYTGARVWAAFGGGNQANVTNARVELHNNGLVDTVFAGGNNATVTESATVNANATGSVAELDGFGSGCNVKTLFGGNNIATMNIIPTLNLTSGTFQRVFGGGNAGKMKANKSNVLDIYGTPINNGISTYVTVNSPSVTIRNGLYGGANQAAVTGGTYVGIMKTSPNPNPGTNSNINYNTVVSNTFGIYRVFGGNDISEDVEHTRVDVDGGVVHNIFGGGNGNYQYVYNGTSNDVYEVGADRLPVNRIARFVKDYPNVGSATVNIFGGTINSHVYGGGFAGACGATHVVIDDQRHAPQSSSSTGSGSETGDETGDETGGETGGESAPRFAAGDPLSTHESATISGSIYGGGRGVLSNTFSTDPNVATVGNVTNATTDLISVTTLNVSNTYAYGGGYGGNVETAVINVHENWNQQLTALYGGCFGSDITGSATVNLYCNPIESNTSNPYNIHTVYGGNDFTGNVKSSTLNVYNGRYYRIYGGGNGDYSSIQLDGTNYTVTTISTDEVPYFSLSGTPATGAPDYTSTTLYVPNTENAITNFYNGTVDNNMYGGGNLGTCLPNTTSRTSLDDYAFVQVNMHGGNIGNDIFAGAAGNQSIFHPLIYGLKVLNMDNGTVSNSVYGGSESVNDGYEDECWAARWNAGTEESPVWHDHDTTRTTQRPSSIVNIVGGTVVNNVYGGGYLGFVNGSAYVNIGKQAVLDSRAYNRSYRIPDPNASTPNASSANRTNTKYNTSPYKPTFALTDDEEIVGDKLRPSNLTIMASVYNGANWGSGGATYHFNTPGFYGGESRIRIDGDGYFTGNAAQGSQGVDLPTMFINYSIIGAGTSCEGGDVLRDIRLLNYGQWSNGTSCAATKELYSIQRADSVVFKNVNISLTGDQDAFSAYPSAKFSITRCDTLVLVDHNVLRIEKPIVKLHQLAFRHPTTTVPTEAQGTLIQSATDLTAMTTNVNQNSSNCTPSSISGRNDEADLCTVVGTVYDNDYSTILVDNGSYIDVYDTATVLNSTTNQNEVVTNYGNVLGYAYLRAEDATQAIVTAHCKHLTSDATHPSQEIHPDDGGFFSLCPNDNQKNGGRVDADNNTINEFPYENYGDQADSYRAWKFGNGVRMRQVAVVAHTLVNGGLPNNYAFTVDTLDGSTRVPVNLGMVVVPLELPATDPGNYYIIEGGITVDQDNRELMLVDAAYVPDNPSNPAGGGQWISSSAGGSVANPTPFISKIVNDASHTFGLAIAAGPNSNFNTTCGQVQNGIHCNPGCMTAISSEGWFETTSGYATTPVTGSSNVIPSLNVYLTFDPRFLVTLMGDVKFTLKEIKPRQDETNPNVYHYDDMGSVDVTISISTILTQFQDQTYELVAMKNGFGSNEYSRKLILPASMSRRGLYLTALEWEPFNGSEAVTPSSSTLFNLVDTTTAIDNRTSLNEDKFGLRVQPTEDLSASMTTTLGWYRMPQNPAIDGYRLAYSSGSTPQPVSANNTTADNPRLVSFKNPTTSPKGIDVGVLDGRSSAAMDITLFFNGEQKYTESTRGRVILHFDYYNQNSSGGEGATATEDFTLTLIVKARAAGDTIYIASANQIVRNNITLYPQDKVPTGTPGSFGNTYTSGFVQDSKLKGKNPRQYLQSFAQALSSQVYQPGDVICVLDTVYIDGHTNFNIHGANWNYIPIVRYSGFNYMFPGENCSYRGPLVTIKEQGRFSTEYVRIDGRMVGRTKTPYDHTPDVANGEHYQGFGKTNIAYNYTQFSEGSPAVTNYYYDSAGWQGDTLKASAPVFEVKDGGVLTLGNNTIIQNCWNFSTATTYYLNPTTNQVADDHRILTAPGSVVYLHRAAPTYTIASEVEAAAGTSSTATSYPSNPKVILMENVTFKNNLVGPAASANTDLFSGAIHLEGGLLELGSAPKGTKILIKDNYELSASVAAATDGFWNSSPYPWSVNTSVLNNLQKANVYLDRTAFATGTYANSELKDATSEYIVFAEEPSAQTRIGISKHFPGLTNRDTIIVANVSNNVQKYATHAYDNQIFFNDNRLSSSQGTQVYYNTAIAPYNIYLRRCATFRKQLYTEDNETHLANNVLYSRQNPTQNIMQDSVLRYRWNKLSACPDGTDTALFSVYGGFYPYTYNWTYTVGNGTEVSNLRTFQTKATNREVNADTAINNYNLALKSNVDSAVLSNIQTSTAATATTYHYTVTATDLTGCQQRKSFDITVNRVEDGTSGWTTSTEANEGWKDTVDVDATTLQPHISKGTHTFRGLHLLATVFPTTAYGMAEALYYNTSTPVYLGPDAGIANTTSTLLCPGDVLQLTATPTGLTNSFIQWSFDPYDVPQTVFVMPNSTEDIHINAYFGPLTHWKDAQKTNPGDVHYKTDYNGTVHIYDEQGLAWLISTTNGLNNQQIHDFYFDTVFIHPKSNGLDYNMVNYLWTPLGTSLHPFRGVMTAPNGESVTIQNIILNEPNMDYVGFFAYTQDAVIENINIKNSIYHGGRYVGGISAHSENDIVRNVSVTTHEVETNGTDLTTIITTNFCSGGLLGTAQGTAIDQCTAKAIYMGSAIYNGGMVGYANNVSASNNYALARPRMTSLYSGGAFGYSTGTIDTTFSAKSAARSRIVNCYVRYDHNDGTLTRAGGLVGFANNTTLQNNYVYGKNKGTSLSGGLGAMLSDGVHVDNCFYERGFDHAAFGFHSTLDTTAISSFHGTGTNVILADTLGHNYNLTRQLNRWVFAHGDTTLSYWHSDTAGSNNGYPVFGHPEYQPVTENRDMATCDSFRVDGSLVNQSGLYFYHVVDSAEFTDSLITLNLTINYSALTELSDTIGLGQDYDGYGFHFTAAELDLMRQTIQEEGTVTVVLNDTLQTLAGCDSVVTLYLTLSSTGIPTPAVTVDLKVYPNPTTRSVTVEVSGLIDVELYDAVSRKLSEVRNAQGAASNAHLLVNLEGYPAGAYYLRIRTTNGTVIKKVIKR